MTELRDISGDPAFEPLMPPEVPLERPIQNFRKSYRDQSAPSLRAANGLVGWRLATFLPAILTTTALIAAFTDWFAIGGLSWIEITLIGLIAVTFFWISLSVSTVTVGLASLLRKRKTQQNLAKPLNTALLVPIYNESPADVFGNACAMLEALDRLEHAHRFSLFILSDTRNEGIAQTELQAFAQIRARLPEHIAVHYRRRSMNTDRKVGNLADWVERWGGGYEAMLVLDADSLMSGEAIVTLADTLSRDESAGLIQSFPRLFGAETLFARVQQFASAVYGAALAEGLARWSDQEGNYWGHNAIIRTAAFASSAGIPRLDTFRGKGRLILSHDFVEAGLLRRAGWGVRFLPQIEGSYEEVPANLIDYVRRDRRWCQGNLQHLNILGSKGFHPVSRFHLFHGAMSYLLSPAWLILLTFWALIGTGEETSVIRYFSGANPQVSWPEMSHVNNLFILIFMYGMLLAPKFLSLAALAPSQRRIQDLGGVIRFAVSFLVEITVSVLYAPILMVQQCVAVGRYVIGIEEKWRPQTREGGQYGLWTVAKFHALETVIGIALGVGMVQGIVTLWLLPIAISLAFAMPLSRLSGAKLTRLSWTRKTLATEEFFNVPPIIRTAKAHRSALREALSKPPVAAE